MNYETSTIYKAVRQNDIETLEKCFDSINVAEFFKHGYGEEGQKTLLEWAIDRQNAEMFAYLVSKGADCHKQTRGEPPLLHQAIKSDNVDIVQCILDTGINPDEVTTPIGNPAISFAAMCKSVDMVRCLKENGANPITEYFFQSPLYYAAAGGCRSIIRYLLDECEDVHYNDDDKNSALWIAAQNGHLKAVQLLVYLGADIKARNQKNLTAVEFAYAGGHVDVGRWLMQQEKYMDANQPLIEQKVAGLPDNELSLFPQMHPDLMREIQNLDLFARVMKVLPHKKQIVFYQGICEQIDEEKRPVLENLIRAKRVIREQ